MVEEGKGKEKGRRQIGLERDGNGILGTQQARTGDVVEYLIPRYRIVYVDGGGGRGKFVVAKI